MAMEACGFAPGLCVFVVFVSQVYQTPEPTMPMLQQPRRGLRSVALIFLMQMLCEELQSPKASFATTCEHFGCRFRIFVVCLHTQRVPMFHKATTLHYVWIFKFMISDADSDRESEIPKYCTHTQYAKIQTRNSTCESTGQHSTPLCQYRRALPSRCPRNSASTHPQVRPVTSQRG